MKVSLSKASLIDKQIGYWLFACCICVFMMVVVGGLTRLTESGLSIVEWQLLSGVFPPFTEDGWNVEFAKYMQTPEYIHKNFGMTLADFKAIYWLEYLHRLFGRITGLVFVLPLIYFIFKKKIVGREILKLFLIFTLGGMQGFIGWWMVQSGLIEDPAVSHFRLTIHLGMAFFIFFLLFRMFYKYANGFADGKSNSHLIVICAMIYAQILLGGLVAGMDAGLIHNTFPLMDGQFMPDSAMAMQPLYQNFLSNASMVQFQHRLFGYILFCYMLLILVKMLFSNYDKKYKALTAIAIGLLVFQMLLGALTVVYNVPITIASLHQANALVMFAVVLYLTFESKKYNAIRSVF